MARRSKLTPETQKRIVEAITLGATYELAAKYGGIAPSTFYEWMNSKPAFAEAVEGAEGKASIVWLAKIEKAATEGNWQAAAWKLERRYPQMYGKTVQDQNHSGNVTMRNEVVYVNDWKAPAASTAAESEASE